MSARPWLEQLEQHATNEEETFAALAYLAAARVRLDDDELRGARRRALLLLATGGDPRRGLELGSRAVSSLAADLDDPANRSDLDAALRGLRGEAAELPGVAAALDRLLDDAELAWRWLACALLAGELADADEGGSDRER